MFTPQNYDVENYSKNFNVNNCKCMDICIISDVIY